MNCSRRFSFPVLLTLMIFVAPLIGGGTHRVDVPMKCQLCGVTLSPGDYELSLEEDTATLYKKGKRVVAAKVRMEPLNSRLIDCLVCDKSSNVKEIRLKEERIIIVGPAEDVTEE